jgi:hypothetical protein
MGNSRLQHTNSIILQADIRVVYAYFIELISQSHKLMLVNAWFNGENIFLKQSSIIKL